MAAAPVAEGSGGDQVSMRAADDDPNMTYAACVTIWYAYHLVMPGTSLLNPRLGGLRQARGVIMIAKLLGKLSFT
ncbi:hypothetical protein ABZV31_06645, partial [Streptomyces sp. NPDC005202]|uniref:hypothetical protein n=1 Tax=Streptomyces sp. NPDC005202 TaxID=3157021 RepID=UPI0033A23648